MNKLRIRLIATILMIVIVLGMNTSLAAPDDQTSQSTSKVELTDMQRNELANLHKGIMEKKKELVNKYVEFGVITEDKGKMMITRFEEHYKKLEANGFIPKCKKMKETKQRN